LHTFSITGGLRKLFLGKGHREIAVGFPEIGYSVEPPVEQLFAVQKDCPTREISSTEYFWDRKIPHNWDRPRQPPSRTRVIPQQRVLLVRPRRTYNPSTTKERVVVE